MIEATSGSVFIGQRNVLECMENVRRQLGIGVCPQHDVHLSELTTREHVELFVALKDVPGNQRQMVEGVLERFDLKSIENSRSRVLSGGEKRRLSVALAMLGDPQLVFLDEVSFHIQRFFHALLRCVCVSVAFIASSRALAWIRCLVNIYGLLYSHVVKDASSFYQLTGTSFPL